MCQIGSTDRLHESTKNPVAVAGDRHIQTVTAAVGIGRCDPRHAGAAAFTHESLHLIFRDQAFHDRKYGLVERHINKLTLTTIDLQMVHGHECADRSIKRCEGVAKADPDPNWRAIWKA